MTSQQIQNLCVKKIVFKLKLNNFKIKDRLENFTTLKLFIPDKKFTLQYSSRTDPKGKHKVEDNFVPTNQNGK
ncbi:hypothetical protein P3L10_030269 [Capsicum annuum]